MNKLIPLSAIAAIVSLGFTPGCVPKPETAKDVEEAAQKAADNSETTIEKISETTHHSVEEMKVKGAEVKKEAYSYLKAAKNKAEAAAEAVKENTEKTDKAVEEFTGQ